MPPETPATAQKTAAEQISAEGLQCDVCKTGFTEGEYLLYCLECKVYLHYRCEYTHLDQKEKIIRMARAAVIRKGKIQWI